MTIGPGLQSLRSFRPNGLGKQTARVQYQQPIMSFIESFLKGGGEHHKVAEIRRLAEAGDKESQFTLGLYYEGGKAGKMAGVEQNYVESAKWYRKAAEQDHHASQLYLGVYYGQGRGVEMDFVEALKWVLLAKRGGALDRAAADETQGRLEALMTEEQINLARVKAALFAAEREG